MVKSFTVTFSDLETLRIYDIIHFSSDQANQIAAIAYDFTREQLKDIEDEGVDIKLLEGQKRRVLRRKNTVVNGKTADELNRKRIVLISKHAVKRMLLRMGSNDQEAVISLIQKIIDSDTVLKAQFKGHPTLSYTVMDSQDKEKYKLPISFRTVSKGQYTLKLVTLTYNGAPPKQMNIKLGQNKDFSEKMEEFRRKLIEESRKE